MLETTLAGLGYDSTVHTVTAPLDDLGSVRLPGLGESSFDSESKWDGKDEFYLQEYDAATDSFVVVGDAIVVNR